MKVHSKLASALLILLMTACGGGSSSDDTDASTGTDTGTTTPKPTPVTLTSVSINQSTIALEVSQTVQLSSAAHYSDSSQKVATTVGSWTSANTSIASVSMGKVTAVAAGDTQISYSFEGQSVDVAVKVNPLPVVVTGLSLSQQTALSLAPHESYTLISTASYSDNSEQDVTALGQWSSSNNAVMSVDKGVLLAKSAGAVTISHSFEGQKAQMLVNVLVPTAITSLDITGKAFGGETLTAISVCEGCDANQTEYTWIIDNNDNQIFNDTIEVDGKNVSDTFYQGPSYILDNQDLGKRIRLEAQAVSPLGDTKSTTQYNVYRSVVVEKVVTNYFGFAGLKSDDSVITWSPSSHQELAIFDNFPSSLSNGVKDLQTLYYDFVATKDDGSVIIWNFNGHDRSDLLAHAPLKVAGENFLVGKDNTLIALDYPNPPPAALPLYKAWTFPSEIEQVVTSGSRYDRPSYGVLTKQGSGYFWEPSEYIGETPPIASVGRIDSLQATDRFLIIRDGKIANYFPRYDYPWLKDDYDYSRFEGMIEKGGNDYAGFSINSDNTFAVWGDPCGGGWIGSMYMEDGSCETHSTVTRPEYVKQIAWTDRAFASLNIDGSVTSWGESYYGGGNPFDLEAKLSSDVIKVVGNYQNFAAIKEGGEVVIWGWSTYSTEFLDELTSGVTDIIADESYWRNCFLAIKEDDSAIFGCDINQQDTQSSFTDEIAAVLKSGDKTFYVSHAGYAALMDDGRVVSWPSDIKSETKAALAPSIIEESSSLAKD